MTRKNLQEQSIKAYNGKIKIGNFFYKLQVKQPFPIGWITVDVENITQTPTGWEFTAKALGQEVVNKVSSDTVKSIIDKVGNSVIDLGNNKDKKLKIVNEEIMKNYNDELDFEEEDDDSEFDELEYPEGYMDYDDEEDSFQNKMKMKGLSKNLKVSPSGRYQETWKEKKPYSPIKSDDLPLEKFLQKKKTVKLKESDIYKIVKKVMSEQENERYMFFQNLEQIKRQAEILLSMDSQEIETILENGHDWAQDHIATAKESFDQVFDFLMNETKKDKDNFDF